MKPEEAKAKLEKIVAENFDEGVYHCVRWDLAGRGHEVLKHGSCGLYVEKPPKGRAWPTDCWGWFFGKTYEEALEKLEGVLHQPKPDYFPMFQISADFKQLAHKEE